MPYAGRISSFLRDNCWFSLFVHLAIYTGFDQAHSSVGLGPPYYDPSQDSFGDCLSVKLLPSVLSNETHVSQLCYTFGK
jgi:hypothetical protein